MHFLIIMCESCPNEVKGYAVGRNLNNLVGASLLLYQSIFQSRSPYKEPQAAVNAIERYLTNVLADVNTINATDKGEST